MTANSETQLVTRMCEYWHNLPGQQSGLPRMSGHTFDNLPEFFSDASKSPSDFYVHSAAGDMVLLQYKGMMKIADLAEFLTTRTFQDPDINLPGFFNTQMAANLADDLTSFAVLADRQGRSGLDRLMSEKISSGSSVDEVILLYENRSPNRHIAAAQALCDKDGDSTHLRKAHEEINREYQQEIYDKLFPIEAKKKREQEKEESDTRTAIGAIVFWAVVGIGIWYYWPQVKSGASRAVSYAGSFIPGRQQASSQPGTNPEQPNPKTQQSQDSVAHKAEIPSQDLIEFFRDYWGIIANSRVISGDEHIDIHNPEACLALTRTKLKPLGDYFLNQIYDNPRIAEALGKQHFGLPIPSGYEKILIAYLSDPDAPSMQLVHNQDPVVLVRGDADAIRKYASKKVSEMISDSSQLEEFTQADFELLQALADFKLSTGLFSSSKVEELAIVQASISIIGVRRSDNLPEGIDLPLHLCSRVGNDWNVLIGPKLYGAWKKYEEQMKK